MEEGKLVKLLQKNDLKAQKYTYEKYVGGIYAFTHRYTSNVQDAEELTTDTFLKAFSRIHQYQYQGDNSFWYWLKKIALNECLMKLRKQKMVFDESIDTTENLKDESMDVLSALSIKEIQHAIVTLPTGYRTVFNLYVMESMTHKEIAEILDISPHTSKSQLFKARRTLQEILMPKKNIL